ncbi:hypothetical protein ACWOC1_02175 [Enterococcus quebecensis]|uniref:Uncharacterized protein n=1 Tax=Enterococcus quebecensis TaxID=903983 RepID=A0A1E5H394_9ENTE|nr:hypothetical protein [Enterococcus quebecensis]OEG19373.1 hypothetical protein BCR23_01415 [Enterococcus quebecensis]OJG75704.1 hypothetical protein RV12_GL000043 [Enterococcus quebecensis]
MTTIHKPDLDTGNFSFPSLPKVPSAQDLANGIVGWFIGDYIQKIVKETEWERDNRFPLDNETILGGGSHLEVYDKHSKHIGEADPKTGELKPGTADLNKKLPR